jgi:DNA repair protein RecO (recombination protein O)
MPPVQVRGIILKKFDYRETSVIIHFLTDRYGKVSGIMKGVRSPRKKVAPVSYQVGSWIEAVLYPRPSGGLELVDQPFLLRHFTYEREKLIFWRRSLQRADQYIPQTRQDGKDILALLLATGETLMVADQYEVLEISFLIRLLVLLGYGPFLDRCLLCHRTEDLDCFSGRVGGTVCRRCRTQEASAFRLHPGSLDVMRFLSRVPLNQVLMIKYLPAGIVQTVEKALHTIISYHVKEE